MDARRGFLCAFLALLSIHVTLRPVRSQAVVADPHAHHAHQDHAAAGHQADAHHGHHAHDDDAEVQECPCAGSPRDQCDFYFTGSPAVIPTVHLQGANYRLPLTSTISTYARRDIVAVKVSSLGQVVSVPSCAAVGANTALAAARAAALVQKLFLFPPRLAQSRLFARPMTPAVKAALNNMCVRMHLTNVKLLSSYGNALQLKARTPHRALPAARRCVVFRLGA